MNRKCERILGIRIENPDDIYNCVKNGIMSIGIRGLNPASVVAIKPNLCCIKSHETGATTDPRVVEGIIRCLKSEYGVKSIYVVESDGGQVNADMALRLLGYERLCSKLDSKAVNLSKRPFSIRKFQQNVFLKEIKMPDIMEKVDFFISVPMIKTHGDQSFTATLKNQFGCNPEPHKGKFHVRLADAIVDLNVAFKPDLIVVDGIVAMGGYRGPTIGVPIRMDTLLFGKDPVAMDYLVARIMGIDPNSVEYLVKARKRGIGVAQYELEGAVPFNRALEFHVSQPQLRNLYGILRGIGRW